MRKSKHGETITVEDIYTLIDSKLKFNDFSLRKYLDSHSKKMTGQQRPEPTGEAGESGEFMDILELSSKKKKKLLLLRSLLNESNVIETLKILTNDSYLDISDMEIRQRLNPLYFQENNKG